MDVEVEGLATTSSGGRAWWWSSSYSRAVVVVVAVVEDSEAISSRFLSRKEGFARRNRRVDPRHLAPEYALRQRVSSLAVGKAMVTNPKPRRGNGFGMAWGIVRSEVSGVGSGGRYWCDLTRGRST